MVISTKKIQKLKGRTKDHKTSENKELNTIITSDKAEGKNTQDTIQNGLRFLIIHIEY